jgi:hypothetical protein
MADIANVNSIWVNGALRFVKAGTNDDLFVIGATTGVPFAAYNRAVKTVTTAVTLAASTDVGKLIACGVDGTVITMTDGVSSTSHGASYTILNTASDGGALIQVKFGGTGSSYWVAMAGNVSATTNLVASNTKATQELGDYITVRFNNSTSWVVTEYAGTWALSGTT